MNPPSTRTHLPRRLIIGLAMAAMLFVWIVMVRFADARPWYRHAEDNLPVLSDALVLNSGAAPIRSEHPGFTPAFLLALDWRIQHHLELLPSWNIAELGQSDSLLRELRSLVGLELQHGRMLVLLLIVCAGLLVRAIIPGIESVCFAIVLLCGSAGILFHGLVARPELVACALGGVLALWCAWRGAAAPTWRDHHLSIFLAGLGVGLAALAQVSGAFHFLMCGAWGWLAALSSPSSRPGQPGLRVAVLPVTSALLILCLAHEAAATGGPAAPAAERLRAAALVVSVLPLVALWAGDSRIGAFLRARAGELALLGGGGLAALVLARGALGVILPAPEALGYWAGLLDSLFFPRPFLDGFLAARPDIAREFTSLLLESPFLFAGAAALTVAACLEKTIPARLKAFLLLLLAGTFAQAWILAHGHFAPHGSIGLQVPLLLVCALAVLAFEPWAHLSGRNPWLAPLVISAAVILLATVPLRLLVKSPLTEPADAPPVNSHTVTYLFDHHAHHPSYRQMMAKRYGDRRSFEQALKADLAGPGQRN